MLSITVTNSYATPHGSDQGNNNSQSNSQSNNQNSQSNNQNSQSNSQSNNQNSQSNDNRSNNSNNGGGPINNDPRTRYGVMSTGSNAGGFPDPTPGSMITGSAATNDGTITKVKFKWIEPDGVTVKTHTVTATGPCLTTVTKYTGGITKADILSGTFRCFDDTSPALSVPGDWGMQATFCDSDDRCTANDKVAIKAVSFFVLPESAIGTIALVGASISTLGGYMFLKGRKHSFP